jgi:hypothetical protein
MSSFDSITIISTYRPRIKPSFQNRTHPENSSTAPATRIRRSPHKVHSAIAYLEENDHQQLVKLSSYKEWRNACRRASTFHSIKQYEIQFQKTNRKFPKFRTAIRSRSRRTHPSCNVIGDIDESMEVTLLPIRITDRTSAPVQGRLPARHTSQIWSPLLSTSSRCS